jgi:putative MFS transporter
VDQEATAAVDGIAAPSSAPAEGADREPRRSVHLGMFGRTPEFTPRQWRVFLIAITAGFFDNYDRALLSLALKQIQVGLKIAEARLGAVLSAIRIGYLLTLFLTPLADVLGRRRLLLYTIVGYTLFTGLTAIAPDARIFAVFQILARAFAGAEAIVALVILSEEVDAAVRGWTYGWRGLYALALIPLIAIAPLRRALPESHRFEIEALSGARPSNVIQPIVALFRTYPRRLGVMIAVAFLNNMGGNASGILFPKYLQEAHGWSPGQVSTLFLTGGGIGILGSIIAGKLSDRFGRRRMGALFLLLAPILVLWIYSTSGFPLVIAWVLQLFFDIASGTILNAYSAELFPTSHRSTAGSALMVAGTSGGAIGLLLEGLLYRYTHSHWTAVRSLVAFWMVSPFVMYFSFPETAGLELEAISPETADA